MSALPPGLSSTATWPSPSASTPVSSFDLSPSFTSSRTSLNVTGATTTGGGGGGGAAAFGDAGSPVVAVSITGGAGTVPRAPRAPPGRVPSAGVPARPAGLGDPAVVAAAGSI